MPPRSESSHALARKSVQLVHLKLVDMLATDDALTFTYKDAIYHAHVTRECYIATPRAAEHRLADASDATHSFYRQPSNFANDCVAVYWATHPPADRPCLTNPSGFERVRHVRSARSLNAIRDEYLTRYATAPIAAAALDADRAVPADVLQPPRARASKRARPTTTPVPANVLDDTDVTIMTIQARGGVRGYKDVARVLEAKLMAHRAALLASVDDAERALDVDENDVVLPPPLAAAEPLDAVVAEPPPPTARLDALMASALERAPTAHE